MLSLAAPKAGLARFDGFEGFEGSERFDGFEAFRGSIRQFRASRKRKISFATAASFAPEKEPLGLPQPLIWQLQEPVWHVSRGLSGLQDLEGASGSFGPVEKERLGLPAASFSPEKVFRQKRNHLACHSL